MNKTITGLFTAMLLSGSSVVSANTAIYPSAMEPDLLTSGGILDLAVGLGNIQRVDDTDDNFWYVNAPQVSATVIAKHAGYTQDFGFIDDNNIFTSLLYVPSNAGQSASFSITDSGSPFRFGLDPSGSPLFSSNADDNTFCSWFHCYGPYDHMVSWLITDGQYAGDYIIAWEDLKKLGDRDYNDLVLRISGVSTEVPVPAAAWLMLSGLLGLVSVARRKC